MRSWNVKVIYQDISKVSHQNETLMVGVRRGEERKRKRINEFHYVIKEDHFIKMKSFLMDGRWRRKRKQQRQQLKLSLHVKSIVEISFCHFYQARHDVKEEGGKSFFFLSFLRADLLCTREVFFSSHLCLC